MCNCVCVSVCVCVGVGRCGWVGVGVQKIGGRRDFKRILECTIVDMRIRAWKNSLEKIPLAKAITRLPVYGIAA